MYDFKIFLQLQLIEWMLWEAKKDQVMSVSNRNLKIRSHPK